MGKDCCKQRSEFGCGDALKPGARGAIVTGSDRREEEEGRDARGVPPSPHALISLNILPQVQLPGPHFLVTDGIPYWKRAVQVRARAHRDLRSARPGLDFAARIRMGCVLG